MEFDFIFHATSQLIWIVWLAKTTFNTVLLLVIDLLFTICCFVIIQFVLITTFVIWLILSFLYLE